jgi:sugar O-acyltransferase (sialic acid O-acetyltransferase NeuD family)
VKSNPENKPIALIGYSGHAYVAADIFLSIGFNVSAYCDNEEKKYNPFSLKYLGKDSDESVRTLLKEYSYFIAIGDNTIRRKVYEQLCTILGDPLNAIHSSAVLSPSSILGNGVFVAGNSTINPLVKIGNGVICNTSCSIDHECVIDDFAHIAPGAVLCGNVRIGEGSFIGANAVIRQGISIGDNVMIGAGAVIVKDVPDNSIVIGNPQKSLK